MILGTALIALVVCILGAMLDVSASY